jgi:hypothetical protein
MTAGTSLQLFSLDAPLLLAYASQLEESSRAAEEEEDEAAALGGWLEDGSDEGGEGDDDDDRAMRELEQRTRPMVCTD